jgi:branched-chain amino acid transport system substrate-binding protein
VIDDAWHLRPRVGGLLQAAVSLGRQVVKREHTNDKAVDFNALLTSIKAVKPDAIFFGGYDAQAGPMAR